MTGHKTLPKRCLKKKYKKIIRKSSKTLMKKRIGIVKKILSRKNILKKCSCQVTVGMRWWK